MDVDELAPDDPDRVATVLARWFAELHGYDPVGVFAAPGRVNLIGEHVDYNDGRCLPMALPHATYAAVATRRDRQVTVRSRQQADGWTGDLDALGPGQVQGWPGYVAGVLWALQEQGWRVPGLDVVVDSRVPTGAGLSSSAALECSVALAVCEVTGVAVDDSVRRELVQACIRAESEVVGAPTGGMDQTIALFGQAGHALLLDCRDWSTAQLPWQPAAHGLELLVVDTRAEHQLADGGYAARRADCERAADRLGVATLREVTEPEDALVRLAADPADDAALVARRARHVLSEMARVDRAVEALQAGDPRAMGRLLDGSHDSLRDDFEVSCAELDVVVDTARAHGALGARMTGGGFGGSAIALLPQEAVGEARRAIAATFAERGWEAPGFLPADPGDGARRIR